MFHILSRDLGWGLEGVWKVAWKRGLGRGLEKGSGKASGKGSGEGVRKRGLGRGLMGSAGFLPSDGYQPTREGLARMCLPWRARLPGVHQLVGPGPVLPSPRPWRAPLGRGNATPGPAGTRANIPVCVCVWDILHACQHKTTKHVVYCCLLLYWVCDFEAGLAARGHPLGGLGG